MAFGHCVVVVVVVVVAVLVVLWWRSCCGSCWVAVLDVPVAAVGVGVAE